MKKRGVEARKRSFAASELFCNLQTEKIVCHQEENRELCNR
jgi:hypothetical protein